jgi:hypothetical protein
MASSTPTAYFVKKMARMSSRGMALPGRSNERWAAL